MAPAENSVSFSEGAAGPDAPNAEGGSESPSAEGTNTNGLPENFDSVESLVKSYKESQAELTRLKQGQSQDTSEETSEADKTDESEEDQDKQDPPAEQQLPENLQPFSDEFAEKGELTEESYQKLEEMGYSKAVVDAYIKGVQGGAEPLGEDDVKSVMEAVGGEESFGELQAWAGENLSDAELEAYNGAIQNKATAQMAVEWLQMKHQATEGFGPKNKVEGTPKGQSAVQPFKSSAELARAMKDPRYKEGDKAYHEEIDKRLAVSDIF